MIRYPDSFVRTVPLRRLLDRMMEELQYAQQEQQQQPQQPGPQAVPVNIFQTPEQVVMVAPMPGASPEDIEVHVTHDMVHIRADYRGPHQEEKNYMVREWSYGPYERTLQLPVGVDATRTNASFNNGVLVLNMPKRDVTRPQRIHLQSETSARGVQQVRAGHDTLQHEGGGRSLGSSTGSSTGASFGTATGSSTGSSASPQASPEAGRDAAVGRAGATATPVGGESTVRGAPRAARATSGGKASGAGGKTGGRGRSKKA